MKIERWRTGFLRVLLLLLLVLLLAPNTLAKGTATRPNAPLACTTPVFINEFHYDNAGDDTGEFIEIAGPAGTDLSGWDLVLYNGSIKTVYHTENLSGVIPDQDGGYGTLSFPISGIQNGNPDGIALVDSGVVEQFLSYGGIFTAIDGPAEGATSTDVGVSESSSTPIGDSLQLKGSGECPEHFTWSSPSAESPGTVNDGQSFTVVDTPPFVSSTTPTSGATGVAVDADIVVNFSENVAVVGAWYNIDCTSSGVHTAVFSGGPQSFTLNPDIDFTDPEDCTVRIDAGQVTDQDGTPDNMASDYEWSFTVAAPMATSVLINEVDADTAGDDTLEFVELYDGGAGSTALDGLVVVFYNGNGDVSYAAFDLDGYSTDANGYFLLGNSAVAPSPDIVFDGNTLQNGADAVALYNADDSDFPSGTSVTVANLVDAIVYDTDDADDAGLLVLLNASEPQVNENDAGDKDNDSNRRCPNGAGGQRNTSSYLTGAPSPDSDNSCSALPSCTSIPEIQGDGNASPCQGHRSDIEGCITGVGAKGFYFQDIAGDGNSATSDGMYAYFWKTWDNPTGLQPGDRVRVSGTVIEYYDCTEFAHRGENPLNVTVLGTCTLPDPVTINPIIDPNADPMTLYERYEGMRVELTFSGFVVGPTNRFVSRFLNGEPEIAFVDQGSSIYGQRVFESDYAGYQGINYISGGFDKDLPDVDFGDTVAATDLVGVLGYQFDKYTLLLDGDLSQSLTVGHDSDSDDLESTPGADEFAVCSFNLENLFDRVDDNDGDYWDGSEVADWVPASDAEYDRMMLKRAKAIATNLANCTVITVQEVEGNDGVWATLVAAISANGGVAYNYDYYESYDPRDITVGILYDPSRVTLGAGDSTQVQKCQADNYGVNPANLKNSNPARIVSDPCLEVDEDYSLFNRPPYVAVLQVSDGPQISVIVNHFKSKRGDEAVNLPRREDQAQHVVDLMVLEHGAGRVNVVALGDLNDVLGSTTLQKFDTNVGGNPLVNLFDDRVAASDRYTYIFNGESEVLDHFIMTADMDSYLDHGRAVHFNADFPDIGPMDDDNCEPGNCLFGGGILDDSSRRSSDHDPVFVLMGNSPTAVRLASFDAAVAAEGILLSWETASEIDNLGFHLYRSAEQGILGERLNQDLIPSRAPGDGTGANYEFLDGTAASGVTYYYTLEDVDADGMRTPHGPVALTLWRIYMPLVFR